MNSYSLIPLVSFITYSALLVLVLRDTRTRVRRMFSLYLMIAMVWSLSAFMLTTDFLGLTRLWGSLVPLSIVCLAVCYYHFITAFVHKTGGIVAKLGYAVVAFILIPLAALGYIPQSVSVANGVVDIRYGALLYLLWAIGTPFFAFSVYLLVRRYRALRDPLSQNKVIYLLVGISLVYIFLCRDLFPPMPKYPIDQIGHLCNAILISYVIMRHQLLDIRLIIRKRLTYSGISIFITTLYLLMLFGLYYLLQSLVTSAFANLAAVVAVVLGMAWMFNPLRMNAQRSLDRLFFGESYEYRQMVLNFSHRMSNILDLSELAEAMLRPITRAVHATQVSLLLSSRGDFSSQFAERMEEGEPVIPMKLGKESPILTWLTGENKPLSRELIDVAPEFKGLWEAERNDLEAAEIELLCPIKSKGNLISILALSKRQSGDPYSSDDVDLLMTLSTEAAVVIENAQLYAQAKQRAHTDELTGLFNHRYFHERLDEEIARCSRFGEIFSLLFLDLDFFKAYNDIYGHLAGDGILKQIGDYIKVSIRGVDMAFRYGGEEFTVMLPQASLDDAYKVGERIRKRIEVEMDSKGVPLTCSLGVASWPTDGVMREEIIQASDVALYHAKQTGRNRICLASEARPSQVSETGVQPEGEPGILSTIYALAATVDAKDHYTYGHSKKVSKYATAIAGALSYSQKEIATLRAAALLHDIGKIGIPDGVLVKAGPLEGEDWEPIASHPKLGVAILKHVESLRGCLPAIQYHHEQYDGSGYPAGLKGDNIPLDARVLAIADAYDAMTSLRPYRKGKLTPQQAFEELKRCAGTQFDPKIVEVFVSLNGPSQLKEIKTRQSSLAIKGGKNGYR